MDLDLTPKKYRPKASKRRPRKRSRLVRNWHNPLQLTIVAVAALAFVGSLAYDYFKSRSLYADAVNEAHRIADEAAALDTQVTDAHNELHTLLEGIVLKAKSEQETSLEQRVGELNEGLTTCFMQVNDCYAEIPFKYQSRPSERAWFIEFAAKLIRSALARGDYELAVDWFNASHVKEFLTETRELVLGNGVLEISAGTNIVEVIVIPLKSDGPRLVPCDPEARTTEFPIELVEMEQGSYLVWATRSDGTFSPYPVFIEHGEHEKMELEAPDRIPPGMAFVPGGEFFFGGEESMIYRYRKVDVPAFFISKKEVTIGEYIEFWKSLDDPALKDAYMSHMSAVESKAPSSDAWDAEGRLVDDRLSLEFPIVGITEAAASAYCKWLGQKLGGVVCLPTAYEWEKAARGVDGRTYPWGYGYDPAANLSLSLDNTVAKKTYPLWAPPGRFRYDVSIYNVYDMAGNVREMTTTPFPGGEGTGLFHQIKGGSALTPVASLQCAHVSGSEGMPLDVGFRYVMEWKEEVQ